MPLNPQAKTKIWDKYRDSKCKACPLHKSAQTVCLMGDGPVPSKLMIVGEAPGFREDEIKKPFSGKSGQYLDQVLSQFNLDRNEIFVTNAVKCRPPENRTPKKKEYAACRPYLESEIKTVKPEFILLLGNGGLATIKKSGITKHRGNIYSYANAKVLPTFHPALILRNPRYELLFKSDIALFARLVSGEAAPIKPPRTILVKGKESLAVALKYILNAKVIAYDIETSTSNEWQENSVIATIAVAVRPDLAFVIPVWHPESPWKRPDAVLRAVGHAIIFSSAKRVAQNAKFDDRWLNHFVGPVFADFDTMIAAHLLDENQFKGLKVLAPLFLGVDPWAIQLEGGASLSTPLQKLARYNAKDAAYTLRLYYIFRRELMKPGNERTLRLFVKLLMPASRALVAIERNGMWIDPDRLAKRTIEANVKINKIAKKLEKLSGQSINWNSTKQLAQLLFTDMKLPIVEQTKGGAASTKESVLLQLRDRTPLIDVLLEWRKWRRWKSAYLENWAQARSTDGRIHPNYKITGTVTGRLASGKDPETSKKKDRGLNVQQVPRDPFIRSIIGAPPGWVFIEADFSQIELRIAAALSRDEMMQRLFLMDEDIHLQTAVQVTGKRPEDIAKEERKKAKAVNFGFLYGMGAKKFVMYARDNFGLKVSLEEAGVVRDRFFEAYRALRPWHNRQRRLANSYRRVQSPIGRVRHLPDILSPDKEVRAEAERQAINSPVQSMASDMMLLAMVILHELIVPEEIKIVGTVHDSLLFEVRKEFIEKWVPIIRDTMEHLPLSEKFGYQLTVPIKVDIRVGSHWSEGEAI